MKSLLFILVIVVIIYIAYRIEKKSSNKLEMNHNYSVRMTSKIITVETEDGDQDNWEGSFWEASDPKRINAYFEIDYIDGSGNKSSRKVRVREYDNELYNGIMIGHCELRDSTRTFRFDRIKRCVDLVTGEIINDVKKYLNKKYEESPERSTDLLLDDYLDIVKVVYYIAKADGQYRQSEKEVIASFIRKLIRDERVTNQMIDEIFNKIDSPTLHSFKLAIGRIIKGRDVNPDLLLETCKQIVATQQTIHPSEQEALDYIEKRNSLMKKEIN
jgi:hypothetical protein